MLNTENAGALCAPVSHEAGKVHIKIISGTVADGVRVKENDIVEVSETTAKTLIMLGKAHETEAPKKRGRKKKGESQAETQA